MSTNFTKSSMNDSKASMCIFNLNVHVINGNGEGELNDFATSDYRIGSSRYMLGASETFAQYNDTIFPGTINCFGHYRLPFFTTVKQLPFIHNRVSSLKMALVHKFMLN
jgi:hypothetical protein